MALEPGDIVQLKSGSPALTVVEQAGETIDVVWFSDETGDFRRATLPLVSVEELEVAGFEDEEEDEDEADED